MDIFSLMDFAVILPFNGVRSLMDERARVRTSVRACTPVYHSSSSLLPP